MAATLIVSLLGVVLVQAVAQGDDNGSAAPDFVARNGERVFINADGSYQIEIPGQGTSRVMPAPAAAQLTAAGLAPAARSAAPSSDSVSLSAPATNVHIVSFSTTLLESYRQEIRLLGGLDGKFIPGSSLLVLMDPSVASSVAALPYVTSVAPYGPEFRGTAATYAFIDFPGVEDFAIGTFDNTEASRIPVLDAIAAAGGQVLSSNLGSETIRASLPGSALNSLLSHDRVQFVELLEEPEADTARERIVSGADLIEIEAGYTGAGVSVNIYDNAVFAPHEQFVGQNLTVVSNDDPTSPGFEDSHGTSVTSILAGSGAFRPETRGIAPDADVFFTSYRASEDRFANAAMMANPDGPYRSVVTVSPWGLGFLSGSDGYTALTAEIDNAAFQFDLLTVQSMGNTTGNAYRPAAAAKNVLSVGGIGHLRNLDPADDTWFAPDLPPSSLGGTGPMADGRIKPDVHFWNDGTPAGRHEAGAGADDYHPVGFAGTSAATAATGGYAALVFEMWADGVFGGTPGLGRDVFDSRPRMATAKALIINTAAEYPFASSADDKNRYQQGWGRPDIGYSRDLALNGNIPILVDETDPLIPLSSNSYTFDVAAADFCAMRTTMAYTDPPGTPGTSVHRVNDLSLRLTSPSGTIYWGNNGLTEGNESTPGGTPNTIDTVENVFLFNPEPGTWTVDVFGDEIIEDARPETGLLDADYALVASGPCLSATPAPPGGITGTVWQDNDANGANNGESGFDQVPVLARNADGVAVLNGITNAQGAFTFEDLVPGVYTIEVDPTAASLADTAATFDTDGLASANAVTVTVTSLTNVSADFGYQVQVVSVGNRVFVDNDFSGDISPGDAGPPAPITVQLLDAAGSVIESTVSDADGFYSFDRIAPGQYRIAIPAQETAQGQGGAAEAFDSTLGAAAGNSPVDSDDNSFTVSGSGIRTELFTLSLNGEPTGDARGNAIVTVPDSNANMTIDLGLFPAQD